MMRVFDVKESAHVLSTGFRALPKEINHAANLPQWSSACKRLAIEKRITAEHLLAKSEQYAASGDKITGVTPAQLRAQAAELQADSRTLYEKAQAYHRESHDKKSKLQKAKPYIYNSIIVTVVLAEIISIPILLANIYMMIKHGDKHPRPLLGTA